MNSYETTKRKTFYGKKKLVIRIWENIINFNRYMKKDKINETSENSTVK